MSQSLNLLLFHWAVSWSLARSQFLPDIQCLTFWMTLFWDWHRPSFVMKCRSSSGAAVRIGVIQTGQKESRVKARWLCLESMWSQNVFFRTSLILFLRCWSPWRWRRQWLLCLHASARWCKLLNYFSLSKHHKSAKLPWHHNSELSFWSLIMVMVYYTLSHGHGFRHEVVLGVGHVVGHDSWSWSVMGSVSGDRGSPKSEKSPF